MSSMNKSCEKKTTTAHSQNILHVDVLYNIKIFATQPESSG
jgi:hypothetical protein